MEKTLFTWFYFWKKITLKINQIYCICIGVKFGLTDLAVRITMYKISRKHNVRFTDPSILAVCIISVELLVPSIIHRYT